MPSEAARVDDGGLQSGTGHKTTFPISFSHILRKWRATASQTKYLTQIQTNLTNYNAL